MRNTREPRADFKRQLRARADDKILDEEGARGILLNVTASENLGLHEVRDAADVIHDVAHPDANIIFGTVIDDAMGEEIRITVIAAGFDRWDDGAVGSTRAAT